MADNVAVTAGSGTNIAADEVVDGTLGTVKVQYVKIMDATLDGTTKAAVGANGLATAHASGSVASGAVASGAIASGAVASGAIASGAFASGSIGSGAMVDVGAIADAAVAAGATGSLSAKLRSISRDLVANIVLAAGTAILGKVGIDQTTDLTTNKVRAFIHDGTTAFKVAPASTLPVATDPAVIVTIRDVNGNGQALMAASAPVTLPSDSNGPYSATANFVSGAITTAMTGTTSTSLVGAPGASLRNYITTIIVSNSHATVGTDIIIQDGSGGTTLLTIPAAAVYGGAVITLPTPLKQPTANTALFCANVTTGASTKVSAVGYKGA